MSKPVEYASNMRRITSAPTATRVGPSDQPLTLPQQASWHESCHRDGNTSRQSRQQRRWQRRRRCSSGAATRQSIRSSRKRRAGRRIRLASSGPHNSFVLVRVDGRGFPRRDNWRRRRFGGRCRRCHVIPPRDLALVLGKHTLVICTAPFLALAKARIGRTQDLASMVGTPCGA